jgi:hypothetical protein
VTDDDAAAAMAMRDAPTEISRMRLQMTPEWKLILGFLDSHCQAEDEIPVEIPEPLPRMASGDAPFWLGPHPDNDLAWRTARLRRLVPPESAHRERLIAVGTEIMRIQGSGQPMPSWAVVAGNAEVNSRLVVDCATELYRTCAELFTGDSRGRVLALYFRDQPEWSIRVSLLRAAFVKENEFCVARELLAARMKGDLVPNDADIEGNTGVPARTVSLIRIRIRDANLGFLPAEATVVAA